MTYDPTTDQLTRATAALQGYEQAAFRSKPSLLNGDQLYASALLAALICDLEHYANRHGLSFSNAINTGRSIHADEAVDETFYGIGDHVRLRAHSDRCGTVIGWVATDHATERTFLIVVPGTSRVYDEPAARLAPAPSFPLVSITSRTVASALQAESAYINLAMRIPGTTLPTQAVLREDCQKLLATLSTWSGVPTPELLKGLQPKLTHATETAPPEDDDLTAPRQPPLDQDQPEPF